MADVSALPVTDWGSLMTSFGQGQANQGLTQAQTGLVQQQTQAAGMQNQILKARLPLILQALNDFGSQANQSGEAPSGGSQTPAGGGPLNKTPSAESWYDPAQIDQGLRSRYFVNPAGTPQEVQDIIRAGLINDPGLLEAAKAKRDFGIQQRTAQSQYDANNLYDAMTSVANAPTGQALNALEALAPQTAARIRKMIPDGVEEDAAARAYAAHVGGAVHQYSGRKVVPRADGKYVDEVTGQPVVGVEKAGLSEQQWAELAKSGAEKITVKRSDGSEVEVPRWQAPGSNASSLSQWVMQMAARGGEAGAQTTVGGAPKAAATAAATKAATVAQKNVSAAPAKSTGPMTPVQTALADKSFRDENAPGVAAPRTGVSQSTVGKGLSDTYVTQRRDVQQTMSENASAAAQALQNFGAAKAIIGAPDGSHINSISGIPGKVIQELARLGYDTDTADKRAEAAKYLTNGALQGLKQTYGAKPAMFDVKVNLEQAFPDIKDMPLGAVRNLIDSQIRQAEYIRDSANRGSQYLAAGNRPMDFNSWNEKYFPRAKAINEQTTTPTGNGTKWSDAQLAKYAKIHFGGDVAKAKAFLVGK